MTSDITRYLIAAASTAYPDGLIEAAHLSQTESGVQVGDTLAEFLALEIADVTKGETDPETAAGLAAEAVERAAEELTKVAERLRDVQANAEPGDAAAGGHAARS